MNKKLSVIEARPPPKQPTLAEHFLASESLQVVSELIDETILTRGGMMIYERYLEPKMRPYTALNALENISTSI